MKRAFCVVVLVVVGFALAGSILADTIILKNGEELSGRIVGKAGIRTMIKLDSGEKKMIRTEDIARVVKGEPGTGETAAPKGDAEVRVLALQIGRPIPQEERMQLNLGIPQGTSLTLEVAKKDKVIVSLDKNASELTSFTDDKNTNLAESRGRMMQQPWLSPFVKISEDGHHLICEINAASVPKTGAREIRLKANIVLICGSEEKTQEQQNFSLKPGSTLTIGPVPMKIEKPGEHDMPFGSGASFGMGQQKVKTKFKLTSEVNPEKIKRLAFLAPDGREIPYSTLASGSGGFGPKPTYWKIFGLHEKADRVTVRVTYYDATERITVPIDMNIGVGF